MDQTKSTSHEVLEYKQNVSMETIFFTFLLKRDGEKWILLVNKLELQISVFHINEEKKLRQITTPVNG